MLFWAATDNRVFVIPNSESRRGLRIAMVVVLDGTPVLRNSYIVLRKTSVCILLRS